MKLTVLGDVGSVGNDDDGPFELGFKVVNNGSADLSEGSKGSEWDSDEDVLCSRSAGLSVLDFFGGVEHELLDVSQVLWLALLVSKEALGNNFFEFGVFCALLT